MRYSKVREIKSEVPQDSPADVVPVLVYSRISQQFGTDFIPISSTVSPEVTV